MCDIFSSDSLALLLQMFAEFLLDQHICSLSPNKLSFFLSLSQFHTCNQRHLSQRKTAKFTSHTARQNKMIIKHCKSLYSMMTNVISSDNIVAIFFVSSTSFITFVHIIFRMTSKTVKLFKHLNSVLIRILNVPCVMCNKNRWHSEGRTDGKRWESSGKNGAKWRVDWRGLSWFKAKRFAFYCF